MIETQKYLVALIALALVSASLFVATEPAYADHHDSEGQSASQTDDARSGGQVGSSSTEGHDREALHPVFLVLRDDGAPIPAEPATEPDPSRGAGAAAATVADDLEPPCVAREGGSGSAAGDAGSLSDDELAARGIESPEATQNHLDAVIQAGAGGDTSSTDDGSSGGGASSQASGEGLKDMAYMPVVVAARPVKSASFWQDGDAESAPSTLESNTAAVLDIWREYPRGTRTKTRPAAA